MYLSMNHYLWIRHLLQMNNVMLAPHNSNSSPAAWENVHWNTIRNLLIGLGIDHEDFYDQQKKIAS